MRANRGQATVSISLGPVSCTLVRNVICPRGVPPGAYILAKKPIPLTAPTIREVIRQIAMLGGFLGRKGDGEPGVKTLRLGLQRVRNIVVGVEYVRGIHAK